MTPPDDDRVVVRGAGQRDLPALEALPGLSTSTQRRLATEIARADARATGDTVALVAADSREVLGAVFGLIQVDDGHVVDLAVAPSARRRGIGRRLLDALTSQLRTRGARAITLEVRAGNLGALALYRGAGFVVEGRRPRYYPDGEDALLLWRHDPPPATVAGAESVAEFDAPGGTAMTAGTAGAPGTATTQGG